MIQIIPPRIWCRIFRYSYQVICQIPCSKDSLQPLDGAPGPIKLHIGCHHITCIAERIHLLHFFFTNSLQMK